MQRKALALISGGLDSMLAAKLMQEQGIAVEGVNFYTGFCVEGHTHAIRAAAATRPKRNNALWVAETLGIRLHIVDVSEDYKRIVLHPQHGYGAHLNPCLDCKIYMLGQASLFLNRARQLANDAGMDFIVTGEVAGQRPKSQRRRYLPLVASESGVDDRVLRPLSAKLLDPTWPERQGWVDREQLYGFHGRSRQPQIALARRFGLTDWSQPSGGCCFLTDESYSRKLRDLWAARGKRDYQLDDILMLKVGRHLRPRPHFKLIIAREEGETHFLEGYRKEFTHLRPLQHKGALCLVDGDLQPQDYELAARIVARYSQGRDAETVDIGIFAGTDSLAQVQVRPFAQDEIRQEWYV